MQHRTGRRTLRIAEAVVLVSTVVAFAVTVLALESSPRAFEGNPITRAIVRGFGWTVAGCVAVGTITGTFALYRRIQNTTPRVVFVGSLLIVAISVADMLVTFSSGIRVEFTRALGPETATPICVLAGVTVCMHVISWRIATVWGS